MGRTPEWKTEVVTPAPLESLQQLSIDGSRALVSTGAGAATAAGTAVEWPIDGSSLSVGPASPPRSPRRRS